MKSAQYENKDIKDALEKVIAVIKVCPLTPMIYYLDYCQEYFPNLCYNYNQKIKHKASWPWMMADNTFFNAMETMQNIDIGQIKQRLPKILEDIEGSIIITKQGLPIAKIVGIPNKKKKRQFGSAKGLIKIAEDFDAPLEDFKEYM